MIDIDTITLSDPRWETSYPNVPVLRRGQSLPGYSLELDQANDLDPGFTFRLVRRTGTGPAHLAAPGKWLSAYLIDMSRLALLAARSRHELELLTARPLMRWLYPEVAESPLIGGKLLGQRLAFALCPRCVESGDLPMASLFTFTAGCPAHGLQLQASCATRIRLGDGTFEICATAITLFSGGDRFYACPRLECGASYTALPAIALTAAERLRVQKTTTLLGEILARAAGARPLDPGFGAPLRAAFLPTGMPRGRAMAFSTALRAPRPSLPVLIEALVVSQTSVEQWLADLSGPRSVLTAKAIGREQWLADLGGPGGVVTAKAVGRDRNKLTPLFPSPDHPRCPICSGTNAYRNGRAATVDRSQEFICKKCGTRFTHMQVLFSFDPHPRYRAIFTGRNQRRLDLYRAAVRAVLSRWPRQVPMTRTAVFARAGVPRAISYTTQRAGLVQIIEAARGVSPRPVSQQPSAHVTSISRSTESA